MKKLIVILGMLLMLTSVGCGGLGKHANLISEVQHGDQYMCCDELNRNLVRLQTDMVDKKKEVDAVMGGNIGWGVGGALFFPPVLLLMDLSDTEGKELRSMEKRYNSLYSLSVNKECDLKLEPIVIKKKEEIESSSSSLMDEAYED